MDWLCDDMLRQCLATVLHIQPMPLSAVCKRWRAVQTPEFWKLVCIKRWPVVAKLPNCDHRAYFKQRIRAGRIQEYVAPSIDLDQVTLLLDVKGEARSTRDVDWNLSAVLPFSEATTMHSQAFAWAFDLAEVQAMSDDTGRPWLAIERRFQITVDVTLLRADGAVAHPLAGPMHTSSWTGDQLHFHDEAIYLSDNAECYSRFNNRFASVNLTLELVDGEPNVSLAIERPHRDGEYDEEIDGERFLHVKREVKEIMALLRWIAA